MKMLRSRGTDVADGRTRAIFRAGLALWLIQTLVLASFALLLMFSGVCLVDHLEQYQLVRNFMANPVEMIAVEALGILCILVGIFGVVETEGDLLDTVWAGYGPFFIGVCLLLLFIRGLLHLWRIFW